MSRGGSLEAGERVVIRKFVVCIFLLHVFLCFQSVSSEEGKANCYSVEEREKYLYTAELMNRQEGDVIECHSAEEWNEYLNTARQLNRLVGGSFGAKGCNACYATDNQMSLSATHNPHVIFVKVDVDELVDLRKRWEITEVPTSVFIRNEVKVDEVKGVEHQVLQEKIYHYSYKQLSRLVSNKEGNEIF